MEQVAIDATGAVLGRLSASVAKMLLRGESVVVVNCEKAVMSGDPSYLIEKYHQRRIVKNKANPEHSPHWPRRPDMLVKRIMRGMLPYKSAKGRAAFKRLRVYMGVPKDITKFAKAERFVKTNLGSKQITIQKLSSSLGYSR